MPNIISIMEMQINILMRYYQTHIRMAKINRGFRETESLIHCLAEHKIIQAYSEIILAAYYKTKHTTTI